MPTSAQSPHIISSRSSPQAAGNYVPARETRSFGPPSLPNRARVSKSRLPSQTRPRCPIMDSVTVLEAMSGTRYAEFASTRLLGPTGPQADLVDCATVSDVLFIPIGVNGPRRRRRLPLRRQQEHGRAHIARPGGEGLLEALCREWSPLHLSPRCFPVATATRVVRRGPEWSRCPPHLRSETNSRQDVLLVSDSIPEDPISGTRVRRHRHGDRLVGPNKVILSCLINQSGLVACPDQYSAATGRG